MGYLLKPAQQARTYDKGYFYPGPAVKNVPITMAPQASQDVIAEFGRPEYAALIANNPHVQPLSAQEMVKAFHIWDEQIGSQKSK
jgi:putative spermidine/putrescine transport system substrate-binding protein